LTPAAASLDGGGGDCVPGTPPSRAFELSISSVCCHRPEMTRSRVCISLVTATFLVGCTSLQHAPVPIDAECFTIDDYLLSPGPEGTRGVSRLILENRPARTYARQGWRLAQVISPNPYTEEVSARWRSAGADSVIVTESYLFYGFTLTLRRSEVGLSGRRTLISDQLKLNDQGVLSVVQDTSQVSLRRGCSSEISDGGGVELITG
jgi:hypothetical protein